jgi:integrase
MESLNKEFVYLSSMIQVYRKSLKETAPPKPYANIVLADKHRESADPVPLSAEWSVEHIVQEGALPGMNEEARDILVICAETGCLLSEVYNVPSGDICLDDEIPHFWVGNSDPGEDETRQVKSVESKRRLPLTGASLEAMKRHPQGFPRYRGTRNFSAIASKHLKSSHPPGATAKGLRHGFENRMSDAAFPNDLAAYMMSHSVKAVRGRAKYGDFALEKRRFLHDLLSLSWCEWPRPKKVAQLQGKKLADLL